MKRLGCLIQPWNIFSLITVAERDRSYFAYENESRGNRVVLFWNWGAGTGEERTSIAINLIYDWLRK